MSLSLAPLWQETENSTFKTHTMTKNFSNKIWCEIFMNIMRLTIKLSNGPSTFSKAQEENKKIHKMATEN